MLKAKSYRQRWLLICFPPPQSITRASRCRSTVTTEALGESWRLKASSWSCCTKGEALLHTATVQWDKDYWWTSPVLQSHHPATFTFIPAPTHQNPTWNQIKLVQSCFFNISQRATLLFSVFNLNYRRCSHLSFDQLVSCFIHPLCSSDSFL